MNKELRKERKNQHIEKFLKSDYRGNTLLGDVYVEHNSLPELDLEDICLEREFLGKKIGYPLMINAITGGTDFAKRINADLSRLAAHYNIPMALGSQTISLDDPSSLESFTIARENLTRGVLIGNLSANMDLRRVKQAIDLIHADAIQLHLNPAQELIMDEGDRQFSGIIKNIENIRNNIDIPIIIKEVGFGMNQKTIEKLLSIGIEYIDISGQGGTNFIEIEGKRNQDRDFSDLYDWGIPTALSIIEARDVDSSFKLIASGGIATSVDVFKALVLGADLVAISGKILEVLLVEGYESTKKYLDNLFYKLKVLMLLSETKEIDSLKNIEYRLTGRLKDLREGKKI